MGCGPLPQVVAGAPASGFVAPRGTTVVAKKRGGYFAMVINLSVLVFRGSIVQSWARVSSGPGRTHTQGAYNTDSSEEDKLEGLHGVSWVNSVFSLATSLSVAS